MAPGACTSAGFSGVRLSQGTLRSGFSLFSARTRRGWLSLGILMCFDGFTDVMRKRRSEVTRKDAEMRKRALNQNARAQERLQRVVKLCEVYLCGAGQPFVRLRYESNGTVASAERKIVAARGRDLSSHLRCHPWW